MINGLMWLIGCQLVGEVIVRTADVPIPGPVVGMVLLVGLLQLRGSGDDATVVRAADGLLQHLQLFFIPAGVGVVVYLETIGDNAVPIVGAMLVSWFVGLVVVAWVVVALERVLDR